MSPILTFRPVLLPCFASVHTHPRSRLVQPFLFIWTTATDTENRERCDDKTGQIEHHPDRFVSKNEIFTRPDNVGLDDEKLREHCPTECGHYNTGCLLAEVFEYSDTGDENQWT